MTVRHLEGATICLDTSVVIRFFGPEAGRARTVDRLRGAIERGRVRAELSAVVVAETLVRPLRNRQLDQVSMIKGFFLSEPFLSIRPVDWDVADGAALIRARHGLQLADAVIVASAANRDLLVSEDRRLLAVAVAEGVRAAALEDLAA